jgi:uncharacterized integral membrane protein
VIIIAFAVANRQAVTVSFDPFTAVSPAYAATLPLFAVIFAGLIVGVLIGGIAAWIRQSKWRRAARKLDAELRSLAGNRLRVRARAIAAPAATRRTTAAAGHRTANSLTTRDFAVSYDGRFGI